jgi:hypothetical protein
MRGRGTSFDLSAAACARINQFALFKGFERFEIQRGPGGLQWCLHIPIDTQPSKIVDGLIICPSFGSGRIEIFDPQN